MRSLAALLALAVLFCAPAVAAAEEEEKRPRPTIVVYDFKPRYDGGEGLGASIANNITGKARRSGRFLTYAEVIQDELLEASPFRPAVATDLDEVGAHARRVFDADIAVWGEVGRLKDGYRLEVRAASVSGDGASILLRDGYDLANVHFIPRASEKILAECLKLKVEELSSLAVKRVLVENLVAGDFEKGAGDPAGWMKLGAEQARGCVSWIDSAEGPGKCLKFDIPRKIAVSYGVAYYSDFVEIEPGAWYRLSARIRTDAPQVIIWLKGYGDFDGDRRVVYKHQKRHYPEKNGVWADYVTEPFRPKHPRFEPKWMRVMLYGYLKPGAVWFDDVKLSKVEIAGADRTSDEMRKAFNEKPEGDGEEEDGEEKDGDE